MSIAFPSSILTHFTCGHTKLLFFIIVTATVLEGCSMVRCLLRLLVGLVVRQAFLIGGLTRHSVETPAADRSHSRPHLAMSADVMPNSTVVSGPQTTRLR